MPWNRRVVVDKRFTLLTRGRRPSSIPGFSRNTFNWAFGCSRHIIHTRIINPPGPLLVTTQGKPQNVFSICLVSQEWQVRFPASPSLSDETKSRGPIFWNTLKQQPLPVENRMLVKYHKPTRPVLVIAKEYGHNQENYISGSLYLVNQGALFRFQASPSLPDETEPLRVEPSPSHHPISGHYRPAAVAKRHSDGVSLAGR